MIDKTGRIQRARPGYTPRIYGHQITCKCPHCERDHIVRMQTLPIVKPRIYCRKCAVLRGSEEGQGIGRPGHVKNPARENRLY
jgi:late competence protein required for DNA uptake (superfamily II DNA/RNA helicase)